jgi:hypothetical protein
LEIKGLDAVTIVFERGSEFAGFQSRQAADGWARYKMNDLRIEFSDPFYRFPMGDIARLNRQKIKSARFFL